MKRYIEMDEGKVYVEVLPAKSEAQYVNNRPVTLHLARLRVSTGDGYLTIRGRKYRFNQVHMYTKGKVGVLDWSFDFRDHIGYINHDTGNTLDMKSAMRDKLRAIEEKARDQFVAEQPGWEALSLRLMLEAGITKEMKEIDHLLADVRRRQATIDDLQQRLDEGVF